MCEFRNALVSSGVEAAFPACLIIRPRNQRVANKFQQIPVCQLFDFHQSKLIFPNILKSEWRLLRSFADCNRCTPISVVSVMFLSNSQVRQINVNQHHLTA